MRASFLVFCAAVVLAAAGTARAAEPPGAACTLVLGNSDQMSGRLAGLAEGRLAFYPAVAPTTRMAIDVEKVERLILREP
ncbi:hypothetical protein HQ576_16650, partial [bacterium]|nr:hypothetical protein [bacterium]